MRCPSRRRTGIVVEPVVRSECAAKQPLPSAPPGELPREWAALSEAAHSTSTCRLPARNLINRAETTAFLLTHAATPFSARPLAPAVRQQGADLLEQLRELRSETGALYGGILKPTRLELVMDWLYRSVEYAVIRTLQVR